MIFLLIITERGLQSFQTLASKREATDFGFGGVEKTPKCIAQYYDQAFGVINGKQENKLLIYHSSKVISGFVQNFSHMRKPLHIKLHTCHVFCNVTPPHCSERC